MARYEANADFQRDYYKRRKLAGRSPGNDDEVSIICFPHTKYGTGGLVRSENEAKILYTVEKKKGCLNVHTSKNSPPRYARRTTFHFLPAFRAAQHSLYTSNLLPTPT